MSKQAVSVATIAGPCCPPIGVESLDSAQAVGMAYMFKALGDPVRLRLLSRIGLGNDFADHVAFVGANVVTST